MSNNSMTALGAAGWIGYKGPEKERAISFYQDVMNWNLIDLPMKDGSSVPGIMVGEELIGGFSPEPANAGAWTIYVTVADVDKATEAARKAGAEILSGPDDVPGVGRITNLKDPFGASIAIITYESMMT